VYPIYEEYWVGTYYESVRQSVEAGWAYATGQSVNEAELQKYQTEVHDTVEYYREEGIDILGDVVTVVLRILESMGRDEEESCRAVARGLLSTRDAAQSAEAMANQDVPRTNRVKVAMAEEQAWQEAALQRIEGWSGVATRGMFVGLDSKPPKWLLDWKARARR
jgi:hypothetical protein